MTLRRKLWFGIGAFALVNAGPAVLKSTLAYPQGTHGSGLAAWAAGGEGGEMGEMGSASQDPATDDVAYLTQLGLVQGHLTVGVALYQEGATADAKVHMKHPKDELYASLLPALEARKAKGFGDELSALAADVEGGKPVVDAEKDLARVVAAIAHARAAAPANLKARLKVLLALTRVAADEYAQGVKDGAIVNRKEYEDAWGFVAVAKSLLEGLSKAERKEAGAAYDKIEAELKALAPAWPSVVPPARVETDASLLYAAAARIELAILSIR
jgi:hypothetical protein